MKSVRRAVLLSVILIGLIVSIDSAKAQTDAATSAASSAVSSTVPAEVRAQVDPIVKRLAESLPETFTIAEKTAVVAISRAYYSESGARIYYFQKAFEKFSSSTALEVSALKDPRALNEWRRVTTDYRDKSVLARDFMANPDPWFEAQFKKYELPQVRQFMEGFREGVDNASKQAGLDPRAVMSAHEQYASAVLSLVRVLEESKGKWAVDVSSGELESDDEDFVRQYDAALASAQEAEEALKEFE